MTVNDNPKDALRAAFKRRLLTGCITAAISLAVTVVLMLRPGAVATPAWIIAVGMGVVAAVANYILEQVMYRKGKNATIVLILTLLLPAIALAILLQCGVIPGADGKAGFPYVPTFILLRALIPLIQLLRDGGRLREGKPCESIGRMKKNTRRVENGPAREYYMLFEDELTHEVHLIRMESMSPTHRYRVFYLPHSGVAVGEIIPDDVTFDPFGNPIKREATEKTTVSDPPSVEAADRSDNLNHTDKPAYDESRGYADTPAYTEDRYANKPDYVEHTDSPEESEEHPAESQKPRDSRYDPHSPERQLAAKYHKAGKICIVLGIVLAFVGVFCVPLMFLGVISAVVLIVVGSILQSKSLKLRCTKRTIALCIDTVRRRSGKTSTRHPIVEYTVEGVLYTKELSVSCSRKAVGELYTIYYDPLDPETVRAQ